MNITPEERQRLELNYASLVSEHRELDIVINEMLAEGKTDPFTISRLKRKKLQLKDEISHLHSVLIPEIDA